MISVATTVNAATMMMRREDAAHADLLDEERREEPAIQLVPVHDAVDAVREHVLDLLARSRGRC